MSRQLMVSSPDGERSLHDYLFTPLKHTEHIFSYPGAVGAHLKSFAISVAFFILSYYGVFNLLKLLKPHFFLRQRTVLDQWKISIEIVACMHHLLIVIVGVYTLFIIPPQDTFLELLIHPTEQDLDYYPITSLAAVFTVGYLCIDLFTHTVWLKDFSPLGKQNIFHHTLTSIIIMIGLFAGEGYPKLVIVCLLCEISGVFMHLREIKGKHTWRGLGYTINAICFFFSFTLVRIVMFPMIINSNIRMVSLYDFETHSTFHKFAFWLIFVSFISIYLLNLFWYYLILRTVQKILFPSKVKDDKQLKLYDGDIEI